MLTNKAFTTLAIAGLLGMAACGAEEEAADITTEEVVTTPEVETVEVPVMTQDTALVQTEVDIDTDVDTIENPDLP